jgi:hypothetical protein
VYLHPDRSAGHLVHSGAFGHETSMHDFSCLRGTMYGFNKNLTGTRYVELLFLHPVGSTGHVVHSVASWARNIDTIFHVRLGPIRIQQEPRRDTLRRTSVFPSGGICFSRSAFQCVRGVKHQRTDRYRLNKERARICDAELVYLHPEGSVGHVVHSSASRA